MEPVGVNYIGSLHVEAVLYRLEFGVHFEADFVLLFPPDVSVGLLPFNGVRAVAFQHYVLHVEAA